MRVLFFTQYFPPEVGATQTRAWEMSRYLASQGHHVTVVTEVPNHPSGIIPPEYRGRLSERQREGKVDVLRLWVWASPQKNFKSRMRFYLSYMAVASLAAALLRGRYDVVYATSPPLFVGVPGAISALLRQVPFIFEVRDLWPESAVSLGELNSKRAVKLAERLELWLYSRAAKIVVVTNGIRNRLVERGIQPQKLRLITNGANTDHFKYDPEGRTQVRFRLNIAPDKFVVMYAGVHGLAQGLEHIIQAAGLSQGEDDITFVFVGEGPKKAELLAMKEELGLNNVEFLPEVPSKDMPAYLSAADCAIVPLKDELVFRGALPSKMFEAMSCSRPVLLSAEGEAAQVLTESGGGVVTRPEHAADIAKVLRQLASNREAGEEMGKRGRQFVELHYSRLTQARKVEELLLEVSGAKKKG